MRSATATEAFNLFTSVKWKMEIQYFSDFLCLSSIELKIVSNVIDVEEVLLNTYVTQMGVEVLKLTNSYTICMKL